MKAQFISPLLLALAAFTISAVRAEPDFTFEEKIKYFTVFEFSKRQEFCLLHRGRFDEIKELEQKCRRLLKEYLAEHDYQLGNGGCPSTYKCVPGNPSTNRLLELMLQEQMINLMNNDLNSLNYRINTNYSQTLKYPLRKMTTLEYFKQAISQPSQLRVPLPYSPEKLKDLSLNEMAQFIRNNKSPSVVLKH